MELVQQSTKVGRMNGRARSFGSALVIAAVIVASISVAILATSLAAGSPARSGVLSQENPLSQPAAVEFRRGERAIGPGSTSFDKAHHTPPANASQENPLSQPAAVDRQRKHAPGAGP
jgi:hypothetical protein